MSFSKDAIRSRLQTAWINTCRRTRITLRFAPFVFLAAAVGLSIIGGVRIRSIRDSQKAQIAAEIWQGDSSVRYSQITCFARGQMQTNNAPDLYLSPDKSLNVTEIETIHDALDKTVKASFSEEKDNSDSDDSDTGTGKIWIDAYSATADCTLERPATAVQKAASASITVTGVGGDYGLFHPLSIVSGAFLSSDTPDTKKIVLDTELAFRLFGTYQVTGQSVFIGEREYVIVGVVRHPSTKIDQATQGDLLRAYIPFSELSFLSAPSQSTDTPADPSADSLTAWKTNLAVTTYEVVLPNRLSGIALQNFKTALEGASKQSSDYLITENTGRFSFLRLYNTTFPIGKTSQLRDGYTFPFWERSAQRAEMTLVFWWVWIGVSILTILLSLLAIFASFGKFTRRQRESAERLTIKRI